MISNIIKQLSNNKQKICFKFNNKKIGHIIMSQSSNNNIIIQNIYVKDKFRNKNYGSIILKYTEDILIKNDIKKISLVAWNPTNTTNNVTDFYLKNNYIINNKFESTTYDNGDIIYDIITMEKILNN